MKKGHDPSMFDAGEIDRRKRKREFDAYRRLKTNHPICLYCGRMNPHGIQDHHIIGRRFADITLQICSYCHDLETDDMKDWPNHAEAASDPIVISGRAMLAVSRFAENVVPFLRQCVQLAASLSPSAKKLLLGLADYLEGVIRPLRDLGTKTLELAESSINGR